MEVIEIMGEQQEIVNTLNRLVPKEGTGICLAKRFWFYIVGYSHLNLIHRNEVFGCKCMLLVVKTKAEKKERKEKANHSCDCTTYFC